MSDPLFDLQGVSFSFDPDRPVLNGLDLRIEPGQRIALTGTNGSGKSTLLQLMVGLHTPQSGTVEAFGAVRRNEKDFFEVRRRAGLVFQDPDDQLFCPTVAEDIAFGPLNLRLGHDEVRRRVTASLEMMDLAGYEDRVTWKLSEGEKRRVCIASVMAMEGEFLLMDEPTGDLDSASRERLLSFLDGCGKGFLIVSHDEEFLNRLCDRRLLLVDGRIENRE